MIYHRKDRRLHAFHTQAFILCRVKDERSKNLNTEFLILQTHRGAFTHWSGLLKPGFYILIPFSTTFWDAMKTKNGRKYTLVIHSKIQINGQFINEPATLLANYLIAYGLKEYPKVSAVSYTKKTCLFFLLIDFCVLVQ